MSEDAKRKPYLDAWLKRTGRELSVSGRLSELVLILSRKKGGDQDEWRERIQRIMSREQEPCFELLTEIDTLLARQGSKPPPATDDGDLFD
ncbi:hypothetical protein HZ994_17975 [Akkermansiaceae bacterium]|nr:hypothetical protein HZ994_17975 [Akkermansiaceae bacterium]